MTVPVVSRPDGNMLNKLTSGIMAMSHSNAGTLKRSESQLTVNSNVSQNSAPFELQRDARKRMRRRAQAVVGTGMSGSVRGAPQPNRDIFVFRVELGDADGIKNYMTERNIDVRNIEKKSNDEAHLKSFKVTVCVAQLVHVLEPDFWPKGVCVRRWYQPRFTENNTDV